MDAGMKDLERLAVLDPARGREPGPDEWARSTAGIERMITRSEAEPARRPVTRPVARWVAVGAVAAAVGGAAVLVEPDWLPGATNSAVAAWTAVPTARTGEQVLPQARTCAGNDVEGPSGPVGPDAVLLAEQRGKATMLIVRKTSGVIIECLTAGGDRMASMGLADPGPLPLPPAGTITLETMSSLGDGRNQWSNIIGLAGDGVLAVDVRLADGRTVQASVRNGWWGAWWPGPEGGEVGRLTVVVHTADGDREYQQTELP